ncbi:MAG: lamin tail domain-containing protein [Candidatus Aenigmarchaeota archaeon]|nr:lamin tail domain-containing protein [Candidatus Aenigmarchaeota archaeon]
MIRGYLNRLLPFLIFLFIDLSPSFGYTAYIFHDGKHFDHVQMFIELFKNKSFQVEEGTSFPNNLTKYDILLLEFDSYPAPTFDWKENETRKYISNGGIFIGAGDGGMLASLVLTNSSISSSLWASSLDSEILYNNSVLFKEYPISDVLKLGSAASYHLTYAESLSSTTIPLLKMIENKKVIAITNEEFNIFGFTLGCGGWVNIPNCTYVYSSFIDTILNFKLKKFSIFSPLNKTYFTTLPYTQIPLNISLHSLNETFYLQIFIDNNLFLNQTFYEGAIINEELNQSIGSHCISIYTNASNVENQTVCYSIVRVLEKPLFITDKDWKNIVSLAPLKQPVLVFDNNEDQINHFIELFKPQQIFLLGNICLSIKNYPTIKISREDLLQFFENKRGVYADSLEKYIYASQIASLLNLPIVFEKENSILDFSQNSTEEIEDFYLKLAKEKGININYIILSKPIAYSSIISSLRNGFIVLTNSNNASEIKQTLKQKVSKLNSFGFLFNNSQNILRGNYLLLIGLPSFEVEDPVEKQKFLGIIQAEDKEDGDKFISDIPYADINDDTYLDFAVGRLPEDENLSSLIFSRGYLDTSKKALVASEYLYNDYFSILVYGGGGMLNARNVAEILEKKGYDVSRLVEQRTNHKAFLSQLKTSEITKFILTYEGLKKVLEKYVSESLSTVLANILLFLKGSQIAGEALQTYFEYDWSSFGENYEDALYYLSQKEAKNESVTLNDIIKIVGMLWPNSWPELTKENLIEEMPKASIIYYEGLGNGSLWILPNNFKESGDILEYKFWTQQITNYQYNGSKVFIPEDIPLINARIVWDNSDFSALGKMKDKFLENGAASFIGASALNYAPFSGEIDSRFFSSENTIGKSLVYALNSFRSDWFTWDPFDITKPGIKKKSLLEFFLFGDPSLPKEGKVELEYQKILFDCKENCELKVFIPFNYTFKNGTLEYESRENLIEEDEPITPIKRFVYYLPENVLVSEENITINFDEEKIENISLPKVKLLSHSNSSLETNKTKSTTSKKYKVRVNKTIDNRKEVEAIIPTITYDEENSSATIIKNITISLKYSSILDFDVKAKDVKLGEKVPINLKIFSKVFDNATIYIEISNSTYTFNFTFNESLENSTFEKIYEFKPEAPGIYRVRVVLEKWDPLTVGPRETTFTVYENENYSNSNTSDSTACTEQKVIINEIMYNPKGSDKDREWIELFNAGNCEVNLTGWKFFESNTNHKITLIFGSIILKPNQFAIISNNATKFKEEYPSASCSIFQSSFSLSNIGEFVAIKNSSLHIIDSVNYSGSWGADDNGKSLELKNGIWVESYAYGGTPCLPNEDKPSENQTTKNEAITGFAALPSLNNTLNASLNPSSKQNATLTENETSKNVTSKNETKSEKSINKTKESSKSKSPQTGLFGLTLSNYILILVILLSITLGVGSLLLLRTLKYWKKEISKKKVKSSKN